MYENAPVEIERQGKNLLQYAIFGFKIDITLAWNQFLLLHTEMEVTGNVISLFHTFLHLLFTKLLALTE